MAKRKSGGGGGASTPKLLLGALLAVGFGLVLGLVLGQQACDRKPAPKEAPKTGKPPTKPHAEPKAPKLEPAPKPEPAPPHKELPPPKAEAHLPRLCIVIDDLGYAPPELVRRLCSLPVPLSVAVLPYQEFTKESAHTAHDLGKEVLLHLPMEGLATKDPGPDALLANLDEVELRRRAKKALGEIPHAIGTNNHMGSKLTADRRRITWVLQEVKARKFFFVDSRTSKETVAEEEARKLHIPTTRRNVFLDDDKSFVEIEKQWDRAVALARKDGEALAIGHIYPETVEALEKLVPRVKGEIRFVRASEVVK
ncbi:MAG TPA: divergent polysaccharide deacetylase family protein [Holophagaceae bacterium]|nr:divergent polysaccharide deacetylase family protein [Holophagaceae bacterium]